MLQTRSHNFFLVEDKEQQDRVPPMLYKTLKLEKLGMFLHSLPYEYNTVQARINSLIITYGIIVNSTKIINTRKLEPSRSHHSISLLEYMKLYYVKNLGNNDHYPQICLKYLTNFGVNSWKIRTADFILSTLPNNHFHYFFSNINLLA